MKMYFDHIHSYHISYAANPGTKKAYIRGRRYMPEKQGLKGTELKPDYSTPELFTTGVKHHITVIKNDRDLFMRIKNPEQTVYCHVANQDLPVITEGRIGLRHMFTRSARYANFRVSRPVPGGKAGGAEVGKLRSEASGATFESDVVTFETGMSDKKAQLSEARIDQLRQTAAARCRDAFESESGSRSFLVRSSRIGTTEATSRATMSRM